MSRAQTPPISEAQDGGDRASKQQTPAWLYKRLGRYQLQSLLGGGTNGKVFRAEDLQLGRHVALKVFSISTTWDGSSTVEQAAKEAKLAAALEHPHIVHVYEVNETADVCYIAMELVEGGNLRDLVRAGGPMEYRRACQLVAEVGEALSFAHERGVIHRDVKPANLMLSSGGRCKLADFGLAILNSRFIDSDSNPGIAGTPQFIAPELIKGEPASSRSDIYSLGATLWYLLTGNPPFIAESVPELLDKQLNDPLPKLAKLRPDVPPTLVRAVAKAMEKDPALRFETAEQFASVLRVHTIPVGGSANSLANLAFLNSPAEPVPVRRAIIWGGVAAMILVAVMAVPVYWIAGGWLHPAAHSPPKVAPDYSTSLRALPAAPIRAAAFQPATTLPSGAIIQATDTDTLARLATVNDASHPTLVAVEGIVTSNQASKHAKYFRITFSSGDASGDFGCVYKPDLLPALQQKFGGADGLGLAGKRIHVTGHVEMYKDHPTIKLESADQIDVVKQ